MGTFHVLQYFKKTHQLKLKCLQIELNNHTIKRRITQNYGVNIGRRRNLSRTGVREIIKIVVVSVHWVRARIFSSKFFVE